MNRKYVYGLTVFLYAGMVAKEGIPIISKEFWIVGIPVLGALLGIEWLAFFVFDKLKKSLPETIEEAEEQLRKKDKHSEGQRSE